jgi:hypothetical protein
MTTHSTNEFPKDARQAGAVKRAADAGVKHWLVAGQL